MLYDTIKEMQKPNKHNMTSAWAHVQGRSQNFRSTEIFTYITTALLT